ncbi:hypothetical protein IIA16_02960, partial [bacterium]|nr:hypothetical protein [bacterium]
MAVADANAFIASTRPARPRAAWVGLRLPLAVLALAALSGCEWLRLGSADPPPEKTLWVEETRHQAAALEAERPAPGLPGHEGDEARQIGRLVWFWFSRRDGVPPEGERLTQIAAFLPEGYSFGCDGGEKRICTRFRESPRGPGQSDHRPGGGGREADGLHSSDGAPAGHPPPGPHRPRDRMAAGARARPEAGRLMSMLMSFQFPQAVEGGYTPEQLDHLAVGLAIQTRMLAQACLPGRPGHPAVTWGEISQ